MDTIEILKEASRSIKEAVSQKEPRDVSSDVIFLVSELTAAKTTFAAVGTSEHEMRNAVGQGFFAEVVRTVALGSDFGGDLYFQELSELVKCVRAAYDAIDAKTGDNEEVIAILIEKDPFTKALAEDGKERADRAVIAELYKDIDVDGLMSGAVLPADSDPTIVASIAYDDECEEIAESEIIEVVEAAAEPPASTIKRPTSVPPPLPARASYRPKTLSMPPPLPGSTCIRPKPVSVPPLPPRVSVRPNALSMPPPLPGSTSVRPKPWLPREAEWFEKKTG